MAYDNDTSIRKTPVSIGTTVAANPKKNEQDTLTSTVSPKPSVKISVSDQMVAESAVDIGTVIDVAGTAILQSLRA